MSKELEIDGRDVVSLKEASQGVVTMRPSEKMTARQGLPQFMGVSGGIVGAKGISMQLVVIPPGGAAEPHVHAGHETAIYVLEGRVETCYGLGLRQSVICQAGDFMFTRPDVPHQPVNLSTIEVAVAIVARNDPREQEHVFPYDVAAAG